MESTNEICIKKSLKPSVFKIFLGIRIVFIEDREPFWNIDFKEVSRIFQHLWCLEPVRKYFVFFQIGVQMIF